MRRGRHLGRRASVALVGAILAGALPGAVAADGEVPVTMSLSPSAVSGSPFTFSPGFPSGFVFPPGMTCSWEIRWGDLASLTNLGFVDETYGTIYVRGKASDGYCDPWTVTLPYSASGKWLWNFNPSDAFGTGYDLTSFNPGPGFPILTGTNGTTAGAGIASSTLPGVWLSMPKGSIIGDRVTATAHPFGGYVLPPNGVNWGAYAGSCYCIRLYSVTNHSMTFTFTATHSGSLTVGFSDTGEQTGDNVASAAIDPRVKSAIRVVLKTPTSVLTRTHFYATATAYGFRGTITYTWYVDHVRVLIGGRTARIYLVRTGPRLITVVATDHYGHRAARSSWVTVHG